MYIRELQASEIPVSVETNGSAMRVQVYAEVARDLENEIKLQLIAQPKPYSKLADSVEVIASNNGIIVMMDDEGKYLNNGTERRVMFKHIGKMVRVGGDAGHPIIRKVTAGAIARGKWSHPGTQPLHFIENAIDETMKRFAA